MWLTLSQLVPLFKPFDGEGNLQRNLTSIPNCDLENCHCEGTEAIPSFSVRLPRTFQVLAMTEWAKGFVF